MTTAFMEPALVAVMASMASRSSSSSLSRTPQAKAPWAPPPWIARLTGLRFPRAAICSGVQALTYRGLSFLLIVGSIHLPRGGGPLANGIFGHRRPPELDPDH